jgi:ABC-type uncharacterized transport system substrate-binding protein
MYVKGFAERPGHDQARNGYQSKNGKGTRDPNSANGTCSRRRGDRVKRREFIALVGGAAVAWPLGARAQQASLPLVGFLSARSPNTSADAIKSFQLGLSQEGFVEGQNVAIRYRWAESHYEKLPTLATELVHVPVSVIAAFGGDPPIIAAKSATSTIPIVFTTGSDPVADGLVASMNRPGGNATGVSFLAGELGAKSLDLMHALIPQANSFSVLFNLINPQGQMQSKDLQNAASARGLQISLFGVTNESELDAAFETISQRKSGGLIVTGDPFLTGQREHLASLAIRYSVPAINVLRDFAVAGGLMSYGASLTDAYRQAGNYVGRILKGEKPSEMPILQPTKFDLIINLKAAKALGLTVPATMLAIADEVIE